MPILEGTETVLIVDDETFMLSLAELMLVRNGYTVLTATSGQEVLHMLELWPDLKIDVAVIDVVMPMMDGFELVERMRKIRPRLPICICQRIREGRTTAGTDAEYSVCAEAVHFLDSRRKDSRSAGHALKRLTLP